MMRVQWLLEGAAVLAIALPWQGWAGPEVQSQPTGPASSNQTSQNIPVSVQLKKDLLRKTVENSDGEPVGKLADLVLDMQTGNPKFAVISSGGLLGIGAEAKPVPVQLVSAATAKKNIIMLKVGQLQWSHAPRLVPGQLAELSTPRAQEQIRSFYGMPQPPGSLASVQSGSALAPAGRRRGETRPQGPSGGLELASDLVGKDVINRQQEAIGEITDLLVDLTGQRPAFAILSAGRLLQNDQSFAVPLRAISLSPHGEAVIDANRQMLSQAKPFDEQAWASGQTAIYLYKQPK